MDPWTEDEIRRFAPRARPEYVAALIHGWPEIERAGINTPLRLCEFMAQIGHETGGFTIISENMRYTSAARICAVWPSRFKGSLDPRAVYCVNNPEKLADAVYGGRMGNTEKGDGYRYRGRGMLQETGRENYRKYGRLIGIDLEASPELLETPTISLRAALACWQKLDLNRFADRHYIRAIGNAINRGNPYSSLEPIGTTGDGGRLAMFERAWLIWGDAKVPATLPGLALGAYGTTVRVMQSRLRDLGYAAGKEDQAFGPTMARAVAGFKLDHKRRTGEDLEPGEVIGPLTEAALEGGDRAELSPERTEATEGDLVEAGSTEVIAGRRQKVAGTMFAGAGAIKGASDAGMLDQMQSSLQWVPSLHSTMAPTLDAIRWGMDHAFWVIVIAGGVWYWAKGHQVIAARLAAHRLGFNLWR